MASSRRKDTEAKPVPSLIKDPNTGITYTKGRFIGRVSYDQFTPSESVCLVHYVFHPSVLQAGPQCGLTALSAATHARLSTATLFDRALASGYTTEGEMFSSRNLAFLAEETGEFSRVELVTRPTRAQIIRRLLGSTPSHPRSVLIAYDKSRRDHQPTREGGARAHWCLLVGCSLLFAEEGSGEVRKFCEENLMLGEGFYSLPDGGAEVDFMRNLVPKSSFVLAKHGKSPNLTSFNLDSLLESNEQLETWRQRDSKCLPLAVRTSAIFLDLSPTLKH